MSPGACASAWPSTAVIGCTSRTVDVRNASSACASATTGSVSSAHAMPSSAHSSSTSARVTPRRHPDSLGGVTTVLSRTRKTFEPVASHSSPRVLANTASPAPRSWANASAHVLGVRDRLEPGDRAALVAHPRDDDDVGGRRVRAHIGGCDDHRGRRLVAFRTEGRKAAGDGDAQPRFGELVGAQHGIGGGAQLVAIRRGEAEARGGVREPVEVPAPRERLAAVDAHGLEHAVADEQTVVERRDAGGVGFEEHAVGPHVGHVPPGRARGQSGLGGRPGAVGTLWPATRAGAPPSARSRPTRRRAASRRRSRRPRRGAYGR